MLARLLFIWMFLISSGVFASGEVMYIHTDGLGSPVARTDQNGNLISRTRYEPYGATAAGATPTIGFTGHVNDPATGLIYMQQRYYDPYAGRFLSTDPVLTDAKTGSAFNRYIYANDNPFKYIDPDGREVKVVGTDDFVKTTKADLAKIDSGKNGSKLMKDANAKNADITIKESTTENSTNRAATSNKIPSDAVVSYNPSKTTGGKDINGSTERPAFVGLAHELGHAVAATKGQHSNATGVIAIGKTPPKERAAMRAENGVRKDHGIPERAPYYTP